MKKKLMNIGTLSFGLVVALVLSPSNVDAAEVGSTVEGNALGLEVAVSSVLTTDLSEVQANIDGHVTLQSELEGASQVMESVEEIGGSLNERATSLLENTQSNATEATAQLESTLTEPLLDENAGVLDMHATANEDGKQVAVSSVLTAEMSEVQANIDGHVTLQSELEGASQVMESVEEIGSKLNAKATSALENTHSKATEATAQLESTLTEPLLDENAGVLKMHVTANEDGEEVAVSSVLTAEMLEVQANIDGYVTLQSELEGASQVMEFVEEIGGSLNAKATSALEKTQSKATETMAQLESSLTDKVAVDNAFSTTSTVEVNGSVTDGSDLSVQEKMDVKATTEV